MKLTIDISPKGFEIVNCVLGQALTELENGEGSLLWIGASKSDLEAARRVSRSLKKAFIREAKKNWAKK